MAKYGKWIGGGLGWALGGPIGGILGFIFGSILDGANQSGFAFAKEQATMTAPGDFKISLLILSAAVMKADKKVMQSELKFVRDFLSRQFGESELQEQMLFIKDVLNQDIEVEKVAKQIRQYMDYPSRLQLLHYLFGISLSDGFAHPDEVALIERISAYLGITMTDFASVKAMFVKDEESPYKILGVDHNAGDEEIKKAYRRMALKYHPDKLSHLGEDVKKAAQEKFQELNNAYQKIRKLRNIP